jgi:hypothetical protein
MKVSEHKATPVIFQFVDVSLIDVNARLLYWRHRAAEASTQGGQVWRQGQRWSAKVRRLS